MDKLPILYQDGIHDDTAAVQALIDGKPYQLPSGEVIEPHERPDQAQQEPQ